MSQSALEDRLGREARDGDQRALAEIFDEYNQPLYRYCLAIVGDREDAEDALQETMIRVLRALPGETREIALRPWLYRIAHNESIELLRRRRENVSLQGSEPAPGGGLAERVEARERLRQLISDLGVLPERQRGALLMREAAGLDFDEIGAALGTTPAVARQTLYEARLGLREMDAGREMDCGAVTRALSDGDRRVRRRRDIRAHLRDCVGCRAFAEEIDSRRADLAAIAPLPAVAATALLHGALASGAGAGAAAAGGAGAAGGVAGGGAGSAGAAGGAGASGGGLGGLAAGAAAKSIGTATLLKGAAALAVVAALGVGAADQGGLIDLSNNDQPAPQRSGQPGAGNESAPRAADARDSTAAQPEAGPGSASQAGGAKGRSSLGPGRAAAPRPQRRSALAGAGKPAASPSDGEVPGAGGANEPGHEKQTSPSAAHGQETAAANHAAHEVAESPAGKGVAEHPAHPAHPTHPTHPPKPPKPAKEAKPAAVTEAPPASAAEHASDPPGKGK